MQTISASAAVSLVYLIAPTPKRANFNLTTCAKTTLDFYFVFLIPLAFYCPSVAMRDFFLQIDQRFSCEKSQMTALHHSKVLSNRHIRCRKVPAFHISPRCAVTHVFR